MAEPGTTIFVIGGADSAGLATDTHPTSGQFCLDVKLTPGAVNKLEVRAQDAVRGTSDATIVEVEQSPCTPDSETPKPEAPKSVNVAVGQPVTTRDKPKKNQPGFATDGDNSSYVEVGGSDGTFGWNDWKGWVMVDLGKLYELSKIVVRFKDRDGSGDKYATKYKVLVSSMSDPGNPDLDNGKWIEVGSTGDGDGGTDTWNLSQTQPIARYVALWLQQDGKPHWKENIGIPFVGKKYDEIFDVSEIEVWDVPKKSVTDGPPDTNTCAAIGN